MSRELPGNLLAQKKHRRSEMLRARPRRRKSRALQTQDSEIPDIHFRPPALLANPGFRIIPDSTSGPQRSLQTQDSEIPDSTSGPQRSIANSLYLYLNCYTLYTLQGVSTGV